MTSWNLFRLFDVVQKTSLKKGCWHVLNKAWWYGGLTIFKREIIFFSGGWGARKFYIIESNTFMGNITIDVNN